MSYLLFGSFNASQNEKILKELNRYIKRGDIYIWFNKEINFNNDIQRMLEEQNSNGNIQFLVTSMNQPHNSDDLLFPFNKVRKEVLFADKTGEYYRIHCKYNINALFNGLYMMKKLYNMKDWEIFVVEGYNNIFQKTECNLAGMREDLLMQIEDKISIAPHIYCIN
ncbi:MAG: hypothetical protein NC231_05595 [Bacillus sp. (in: Bacteria)]|nr:hypothetical protein [Bacillus sp. (in: firmicutes)]MCM1425752.1 hypothetical protein [Eubacterium sp.]